VPKIASYWFAETSSAGRYISFKLETVMAHLKVGAQKNIVKGPAGCARNEWIGVGSGSLSAAA